MQELSKTAALLQLARHKEQLLQHPSECVMCALAEQRDPALVLRHEACGTAVLDRFGNRAGHLLIVSRRHVERLTELAPPEYAALQQLAYQACVALERVLSPERVFVAALGSRAEKPMTFPHFHLHVVPVLHDDERSRPAQVFSWTEGVITYDDAQAEKLVSELRRAWPSGVP